MQASNSNMVAGNSALATLVYSKKENHRWTLQSKARLLQIDAFDIATREKVSPEEKPIPDDSIPAEIRAYDRYERDLEKVEAELEWMWDLLRLHY